MIKFRHMSHRFPWISLSRRPAEVTEDYRFPCTLLGPAG